MYKTNRDISEQIITGKLAQVEAKVNEEIKSGKKSPIFRTIFLIVQKNALNIMSITPDEKLAEISDRDYYTDTMAICNTQYEKIAGNEEMEEKIRGRCKQMCG